MNPAAFECNAVDAAQLGAKWVLRLYTQHPALWTTYLRILDEALNLEGIRDDRCSYCGEAGCLEAAS